MSKRYTSSADVARLFLNQNGACRCGKKLSREFHIDHIIALINGGEDAFQNKQVLCIPCHKRKTGGGKATSYGSDLFERDKTNRLMKDKKPNKSRGPKRKFGQ